MTWKNVGTMVTRMVQLLRDLEGDESVLQRLSSIPTAHPTHYANDQGGQGTGIYIECYDFASDELFC